MKLATPVNTIADHLPDAVLRINQRGQILEANQTTFELFSGLVAPLSHVQDLFPTDVQPRLLSAGQQAIRTNLPQQVEFEFQDKHFLRQFEARLRRVNDQEVVVVLRDITEQRWLQQARAFSGRYFQSLVEHLNTGVLICTPSGEIILANESVLRMLHQRDEDLVGEHYVSLVQTITDDRETLAALLEQYENAIEGQQNVPQVTLPVASPHTPVQRWLVVNADLERDPETQTRQLKFTFTDVTDFRNAEIALQESEEQYAALLDRVTDVIYHLDHNQEIMFVNAAWPRLTGNSLEDSLGRQVLEFIHPEDRAACTVAFQSATPSDNATDVEARLLRPAGGICWVALRNQQLIGADGMVLGNYGMMIDISDRKRTEAIRAALAAKARTVELLTGLLTNLSHDLRTPLSIIGVTNFKINRYWEKLDVTERSASLTRIDEQVSRINAFLEEYSDLARLDIDLADFKTSPVALNPLVDALIYAVRSEHSGHEWRFQKDMTDSFIQGHHEWLNKMFRHLLNNAAQFSPSGGTIDVGLHRQDDLLYLTVADSGIGIDAADLEHIFEPFYRADKARAVETGLAGLGLTFVKRITEAHRGKVYVESTPGVGTTVRLQLPVYEATRSNTWHGAD
jgi:PAS domain S-box-containing protein